MVLLMLVKHNLMKKNHFEENNNLYNSRGDGYANNIYKNNQIIHKIKNSKANEEFLQIYELLKYSTLSFFR